VAVFGGSAAHGYGVLEPGSFPHRLEQQLQRAVTDREIQVINMGTIAWSSQQLLWAGRQLYDVGEWDLIVVYSGHNELLELSSWKTYMKPGEHRRYTRVLLLNQRLGGLRLYRVLRTLLGKAEPPELPSTHSEEEPTPPTDPNEIVGGQEELLAGLEPGIDPITITPAMRLDGMNPLPPEQRARIGKLERRYAARTYTHNIGELIGIAREHDTPVILMNPAPNDSHDPAWFPYPGQDGERFEDAIGTAVAKRGGDGADEAGLAALALQPNDPRAHFVMGNNLLSVGRDDDALHHFTQARRWAEYPNRVVPEVSDAIRAFEGEPGVLAVIDIEELFRLRDPHRFIGYDLVYDHCHPSAPANHLVAARIADVVLTSGLLHAQEPPPLDDWAQEGWDELTSRTAPDPRLWEWTGLEFLPDKTEYIADFQGDWNDLAARHEQAVSTLDATAMHWLWAGNARFYGYDVGGALEAWHRAWAMDPGLCLAHANSAHALRLVGARAEALEQAKLAVRCAPDNAEYVAERDLLLRLKR
jgi:tetratricopeptide (TPR) repeat protein